MAIMPDLGEAVLQNPSFDADLTALPGLWHLLFVHGSHGCHAVGDVSAERLLRLKGVPGLKNSAVVPFSPSLTYAKAWLGVKGGARKAYTAPPDGSAMG